MAKFPPGFSLQASPIKSALSEGRVHDARRMVVDLLKTGKADEVVQAIAADLLAPPKRSRGRRKTMPAYWFEIAEEFYHLRWAGRRYEDALALVADKYGYSESHCRNAIAQYDEAKAAADEASGN
ncbi:Hypothetical protein NGAL_HAMBI2605_09390 [Neorhizobium galegae bv. orientalis]|nr:Hypothetical protein NGAL_HAMBI2605_09390 [Neorhizobium galegae bv. orientalis]